MAALTVATAHFSGGFGRHIDARLVSLVDLDHAAHSAVALFFVISGCVMVLASASLFGQASGPLVFWRRRAVRVVPPYWIATMLLVLAFLALGLPVPAREVLGSLLFVPYPSEAHDALFLPFLWPGWTLFYEMIFYLVFGCFVFAGRTRSVLLVSLALILLVGIGYFIQPQSIAAIVLTRPVLLLFIAGMAMGLAIARGATIPGWGRIACLLAAVCTFIVLPAPTSGFSLDCAYLLWTGVPAILLFAAVLGGPLTIPFERAAMLGGDASYAIYLLHVPLAHVWIRGFLRLHYPGGSIGFVITALGLLVIVALAFHHYVERPMTDRLNVLLGGARARQ